MRVVMAFISGLIFGLGLILSGMTNPAKVIGFLDITGSWDPSLAFVMGGAVIVASLAFRLAKRRTTAWLGDAIRLPASNRIDRRLLLGSLTFGIGWGLAGYCPGPALASLLHGGIKPWIFFIAMIAGMALYEAQERARHVTPMKQK